MRTPPVADAVAPDGATPRHACLNCGAALHGLFCSDCGQSADDHHRSIARLAWEGVEGLTHLDGRLARTLPLLFFRPGELARDYREGRRARHVPPFRLFFVSLLLFMLALEGATGGGSPGKAMTIVTQSGAKTTVTTATPSQMAEMVSGAKTPEQLADEINHPDAAGPKAARASPAAHKAPAPRSALQVWLGDHMARAMANQAYFKLVAFTWAHRLAILLLPIFAGQLTLLYAWRKQFYVYDHLVVSMQFLAFTFLISAVAWLPPDPVRGVLITGAFLWAPINLYLLLRGAYGSGRVGALARSVWLSLSTQVVFAALVVGLLVLSLQQL